MNRQLDRKGIFSFLAITFAIEIGLILAGFRLIGLTASYGQVHDGWMYWLTLPTPDFRPDRQGLARQFDAFIASVRFIPAAPTPTPTTTPTPMPPVTPAPTPVS